MYSMESESIELKNVIKSFKTLCSEMLKPNMFIMPYDNNNPLIINRYEKVLHILSKYFDTKVFESKCSESSLFSEADFWKYKCIAIDSGKSEKIRDTIKEALWLTGKDGDKIPTLSSVLSANANADPKMFDLAEYGKFIPYKVKKHTDIRTQSFIHKPIFYRYRVALGKVDNIPENLKRFLCLLFDNCPNHLFHKSEFRASARTKDEFRIEMELERNQGSELIELAKKSYVFNQFKSRHENLQKYFLLHDPYTIACEVPLWLEESELQDYGIIFKTNDILTGHVDVLRYEKDGKVGIWDYKPNAIEEKYASVQIWLYALMVSVRTGISLHNIKCGYFDEINVFSFEPVKVMCEL